jgi:hypothetical protein
MNVVTESQRSAARPLGLALVLGMAVVMFGNLYLAADLYVAGDAAQTAANILAHETRFRVQLLCNLFYVADVLVVIVAQYLILKPVGQGVALTALLLRLIFAISWCMSALYMLDALSLLGDAPYLKVFETDRLQALARIHLHGTYSAYYIGLPFWAVAATLSSWQWLKSGYIPKVLAWSGILASAWCAFCGAVFLVFPHFDATVNAWFFDSFMGLFELALGVWLLVKGLKPRA